MLAMQLEAGDGSVRVGYVVAVEGAVRGRHGPLSYLILGAVHMLLMSVVLQCAGPSSEDCEAEAAAIVGFEAGDFFGVES